MVNQKELKKLLHYDKDTGILTYRIKPKQSHITIGEEAGCDSVPINNTIYRKIRINKREYKAHRLVWLYVTGSFPEGVIDHIDGNGLNNKFDNLRDTTAEGNMQNTKMCSRNKSGFTGVNWNKSRNRWQTRINYKGKRILLGYFKSLDEAIEARKAANIKYGYHPNHGKIR